MKINKGEGISKGSGEDRKSNEGSNRPDIAGMATCFQPRQWFPHGFDEGIRGGRMMWVYRPTVDDKWQVGFFYPDGQWFTESVFDDQAKASARVRWLNGGSDSGDSDHDGG